MVVADRSSHGISASESELISASETRRVLRRYVTKPKPLSQLQKTETKKTLVVVDRAEQSAQALGAARCVFIFVQSTNK